MGTLRKFLIHGLRLEIFVRIVSICIYQILNTVGTAGIADPEKPVTFQQWIPEFLSLSP